MKIGIIGAGKVGCSIGKYLKKHDFSVAGYCSKSKKSVEEAATFTNTKAYDSLAELVAESIVSVSDMSGPVGIVSTISEVGNQSATVRDGLQNIAYLGAFIAINLAVMNMLPLPALDGGRIFLLLVNSLFTAITKKKIPAKYE